MNKKILCAVLAGLLFLLSGCGEPEDVKPTTDATTQATEETQTTAQPEPEPRPSYTQSPRETLSPVSFEGVDGSTVEWSIGNRILLLEDAQFAIYLCKYPQNSCIAYDIQMENKGTTQLKLVVSEFYFNGNTALGTAPYFYAEPGQWGRTTSRIPFPIGAALGEMDPITRLDILLTVTESPSTTPILQHGVRVNLTGEAVLTPFYHQAETKLATEPVLEYFFSGQQLLTEQDGVRVTVLQVGRCKKYNDLLCHLRIVNTTDQWRYYQYSDISVNGLQCTSNSGRVNLRPGTIFYHTITVNDFYGMEKIGAIDLRVTTGEGQYQEKNPATSGWFTVVADTAAQGAATPEFGQLLLQEQDLEVYLHSGTYSYSGDPVWQIAIVNRSDKDLSLTLWDIAVGSLQGSGSEYMGVLNDNDAVYAGKTVIMEVQTFGAVDPVSFRLRVKDQQTNEDLYITENKVSLALPEETGEN